MMKRAAESFEMPLLASNMTPLICHEISQLSSQKKEFNQVTPSRNVYEVIKPVERPQEEAKQAIMRPSEAHLSKESTMVSDAIEQKSISPPYSTEASASYRAEILRLAQRRDVLRLRKTVTMLVQHEKLSVDELNKCLILHHICWSSELNDVAQFLMVLGCNPYYGDAHGDTALHYAARGLNLSLLKYFFNVYGYTILETLNKNNFNIFLTVVIEASDEVSYEILHVLEWLYLNGCSIENQDIHGRTGLMCSCQRGSCTLVQWFLSRGSNLAHRDHNGRTVLQMACVSGNEETIRIICEYGAINLLDCKSIDDPSCNTALKICWNQGYVFLALSLQQWNIQKRLFGTMHLFRSSYASYYWTLTCINLIIFLSIARSLIHSHYEYWYHCFVFLVLYIGAQMFWLIAYKADPGYVKTNIIPDQSYRCTLDSRFNIVQRPVYSYRVTSACYKLQILERDLVWINAELVALNRNFGIEDMSETRLPTDADKNFQVCLWKIQKIRQQMLALSEQVGKERQQACPGGYANEVLQGSPRRVCITCCIIKPFRAHHCSDCAHCIHRFDHHCIWIDNCVGIGNQRAFFLFLLLLSSSILYFWYLVGIYYTSQIINNPEDVLDLFTEPLFYIALTNSLCNILWAGFVGYLLGRTLKSMCTNMTFYEYLKKPPHILHRFEGQIYNFFWDLQDLSLPKLIRNMFSFWFLDPRWDKDDYQGVFDHTMNSHDELQRFQFPTETYPSSKHNEIFQLADFPRVPYGTVYNSMDVWHNELPCPIKESTSRYALKDFYYPSQNIS
ncbi:putative ZDHHC-type palmitoyltransferase 5 isoform X2 [Hylaeus volcanicus]|uniref:putative ZDHHC-type palmitoyltransferase 5 isoform X2 n=1 Tax=Hylaeus volcanicus TaxID=313075 RepID=UPI0023B7EDF1|nr:putative ZDHHC-type palmitoyltransferase 5 isoform X2 [Hylaeus volcanicus]